jgi:hypothetical protein
VENKKDKWISGGVAAGALAMLAGLAIGVALGVSVDVSQKAAWWEIMTALGTVGATTSAVGIAVWNRVSYTEDAKAAADRYARSNLGTLILMRRRALDAFTSAHILQNNDATAKAKEVLQGLQALDIERIGLARPITAEYLSDALFNLSVASDEIERLPESKNRCVKLLGDAESAIGNAYTALLQDLK